MTKRTPNFDNEVCQYMECKNRATGSTYIRIDNFWVLLLNCDKHIHESLDLSEKLSETYPQG